MCQLPALGLLIGKEIGLKKRMIQARRLILVCVLAVTLMLEHEPKLEHLLGRSAQLRDYLAEHALFLRRGHDLEQLVEAIRWENLPCFLGEKQEFTEDEQDRLFLVLELE